MGVDSLHVRGMWQACSGAQACPSRNGEQRGPRSQQQEKEKALAPAEGESYWLAAQPPRATQADSLRGSKEPDPQGYEKPRGPLGPRIQCIEASGGPQGFRLPRLMALDFWKSRLP